MTSMERLQARLAGKRVDRAPNLNILMAFAAKYGKVGYADFILKPEAKCKANILCHEAFGIDCVTVMSDPYTEAEAFGCEVEYPENDHPHCIRRAIEDYDDIKKLKIHDPVSCRRMHNTLQLIDLYKREVGNEVPIIGWVEGPVAEFADIYDINSAMMDLIAEPEWAEEVMDICTEQAILFAKAQIAAGAHIIGMGDAAASIVGGPIYREMILPREKKIVDAIHAAGAMVKLHICGDIGPILPDIRTLGCEIVDIDWMVDFAKANRVLAGVSSVSGNLDPVRTVMDGTPESVRAAVKQLLDETDATSIISGGCEIPKNTAHENLKAFDEALCAYPY